MQLTQDIGLDAVGDVNAIKSFPEFFRKTTALLLFDLCLSGDVCNSLHPLIESMTENWDLSPVSCWNICFFIQQIRARNLQHLPRRIIISLVCSLVNTHGDKRAKSLTGTNQQRSKLEGISEDLGQFMLAMDLPPYICPCICRQRVCT